MIRFLKHIFILLFIFNLSAANAQKSSFTTTHKVVAGETAYSISHKYGLTADDLRNANPKLVDSNYGLKAGSVIVIPTKSAHKVTNSVNKTNVINVGVMLPLNNSKEGEMMVEYYRGILMACNELKKEHYNINIHAWDVNAKTDIEALLNEKGVKDCHVIFGPYYSHQISKISNFAKINNIRLAIPAAPARNEILSNDKVYTLNVFNPTFDENACEKFFKLFDKVNPVIIDCNDGKNGKGEFTTIARKYFDKEDIKYNITNLNSEEKSFVKAFKKNRTNIVILNSSGINQFGCAVNKMKAVRKKYPEVKITMLGYNDWFSFEKYKLADFAANDVYIPSYFYYNSHSSATKKIEADYYRWFNDKMQQTTPRYAISGYDHAIFFLRGINRYGNSFTGAKEQNSGSSIQMPLHFDKISADGGYRNAAFMFIHYKKDQSIESLAY